MSTTSNPSSNLTKVETNVKLANVQEVGKAVLVYVRTDGCTVTYTRVCDGSICRTVLDPNGQVFTSYIL
jgi:hypothetical protein